MPARIVRGDDADLDVAMIEVKASPGVTLPTNLPNTTLPPPDTMQASSQVTSVDGDWILVVNMITRLSHEGNAGSLNTPTPQ